MGAKPLYKVTDHDLAHAIAYFENIHSRFSDEAIALFNESKDHPLLLQQWIDFYLSPAEFEKFKNAIRQRRKRFKCTNLDKEGSPETTSDNGTHLP